MHEGKVWQVTLARACPDAPRQVLVGRVVGCGSRSVRLLCQAFHVAPRAAGLRDIGVGLMGVRAVPWDRVEATEELPDSFDFSRATLAIDHDGNYVLFDGFSSCVLLSLEERLRASKRKAALQPV